MDWRRYAGSWQPNSRRMDFSGLEAVCRQLAAEQAKDGFPWGELCLDDGNGAPIRVLSPTHDQDEFKAYFDDYIDKVWQRIASNAIQFDTQDGNPLVSCQVQGEAMTCDRTSRPFPKPTSTEDVMEGRNLLKNSQAVEMCLWCCRCLIFATPELLESATAT